MTGRRFRKLFKRLQETSKPAAELSALPKLPAPPGPPPHITSITAEVTWPTPESLPTLDPTPQSRPPPSLMLPSINDSHLAPERKFLTYVPGHWNDLDSGLTSLYRLRPPARSPFLWESSFQTTGLPSLFLSA